MDKLRLRFEKTGRAVYISHLDLMNTMQRGFARAQLPLKFSEGFNPHPLISIPLPLSVGAESVCELMDFRVKEDVDLAAMPAQLTAALPEGICVTEAYEPERKCALIKWLEIEGIFEYDDRDPAVLLPSLEEFYQRENIVITKKTKRGMGEMELKGQFSKLRLAAAEDGIRLSCIVSAQEPTVNPELLAEALRQLAPELAPDFAKFRRIETYDAEMKIFR